MLADTDADGLSDSVELTEGTNPLVADTDGDGYLDGEEVAAGTDPLVANAAIPATEEEGCGCNTRGAGSPWIAALAALALARRRASSARSSASRSIIRR